MAQTTYDFRFAWTVLAFLNFIRKKGKFGISRHVSFATGKNVQGEGPQSSV